MRVLYWSPVIITVVVVEENEAVACSGALPLKVLFQC
jgi:hypothetical protein